MSFITYIVSELEVIREFPPEHELIAFFEAEPVDVHEDFVPLEYKGAVTWPYNTLDFTTTRGAIEVRCQMHGSFGDLTACLILAGAEIAKFELKGADAFHLDVTKDREALVATFQPGREFDNFTLQLKPRVWAAWRQSERGSGGR
jgi:hypothetical protein